MKNILLVFAILVMVAVSCVPISDRGEEGKACFKNGTCLEGLVCDKERNICVKEELFDGGVKDVGHRDTGITDISGEEVRDYGVDIVDAAEDVEEIKDYGVDGCVEIEDVVDIVDNMVVDVGDVSVDIEDIGKDVIDVDVVEDIGDAGDVNVNTPNLFIKQYGGNGQEAHEGYIYNTLLIEDNNEYVVATYSWSFSQNNQKSDIWIMRLNRAGEIIKQFVISGDKNNGNSFFDIKKVSDSGYLLLTATESYGATNRDVFAVKLKPDLSIDWEKRYDLGGSETGMKVIEKIDKDGYLLVSRINVDPWKDDGLIIDINRNGDVNWTKSYRASEWDFFNDITYSIGGDGYVLCGYTNSWSNPLDNWVVKIDKSGNIKWQKHYGTSAEDTCLSLTNAIDGGYIIAGTTRYLTYHWNPQIMKVDKDGNLIWAKVYDNNGIGSGGGFGITPLSTKGGYIMGNWWQDYPNERFYLLKLGIDGELKLAKRFATDKVSKLKSVIEGSDNSIILTGYSENTTRGVSDLMIAKLGINGESCNDSIVVNASVTAKDLSVTSKGDTQMTPQTENIQVYTTSSTVTDTTTSPEAICDNSYIINDNFDDGVYDKDWTVNVAQKPNDGNVVYTVSEEQGALHIWIKKPSSFGCSELRIINNTKISGSNILFEALIKPVGKGRSGILIRNPSNDETTQIDLDTDDANWLEVFDNTKRIYSEANSYMGKYNKFSILKNGDEYTFFFNDIYKCKFIKNDIGDNNLEFILQMMNCSWKSGDNDTYVDYARVSKINP
jgi:hypothetical protein